MYCNRYKNISESEWPEPRSRLLSHECEMDGRTVAALINLEYVNFVGISSYVESLSVNPIFVFIWWDCSE